MSEAQLQVFTFRTTLGWIGVVGSGQTVWQITFGHASEREAYALLVADARHHDWCPKLVARLKQYAAGEQVDFRDVKLNLDHLSAFQREVVRHCRAIGYGQTRSYGELAQAAGSTGAARAVGTTMAKNRFPLVVPCHRVVASGGGIGGFSAPNGLDMKMRLLALEDHRPLPRSPAASAARSRCKLAAKSQTGAH
jgi:methylated-DNA-[protein]-cysteine S-methyltransferase